MNTCIDDATVGRKGTSASAVAISRIKMKKGAKREKPCYGVHGRLMSQWSNNGGNEGRI